MGNRSRVVLLTAVLETSDSERPTFGLDFSMKFVAKEQFRCCLGGSTILVRRTWFATKPQIPPKSEFEGPTHARGTVFVAWMHFCGDSQICGSVSGGQSLVVLATPHTLLDGAGRVTSCYDGIRDIVLWNKQVSIRLL